MHKINNADIQHDMNIKEEIEKLGKGLSVSVGEEIIEVGHNDFLFEYEFTRLEDDNSTLERIKNFMSCKYTLGKSIYRKDYYETVINVKNFYQYGGGIDGNLEIPPTNYSEGDIYYSVGDISEDFEKYLNETIHWDNFSTEYFISLKIFNADTILKLDERKDNDIIFEELIQSVFFDLHYKHNLQIELTNLADDEKFDGYYWDEKELGPIESTKIHSYNLDKDLIAYYNRASKMDDSEFKYLAYFQVLECIFDEVYKYETIQDVKSILQTNWFSNNNNDHIDLLIAIVDRYNKDKNDRNKTKLVLDKYFKGELHEEAYLLVNKEIVDLLTNLKLIKKPEDIKDTQTLSNIIYDIRCDCTHSNRSYPIKQTTLILNEKLDLYIELIKKIAERIILNYKK